MNSIEEKRIMDYAKLNINEVWNLDIVTYWALLRDAVIYDNMKTDEGREYLYDCWRMEQKKPDRQGLRNQFRKKVSSSGRVEN